MNNQPQKIKVLVCLKCGVLTPIINEFMLGHIVASHIRKTHKLSIQEVDGKTKLSVISSLLRASAITDGIEIGIYEGGTLK